MKLEREYPGLLREKLPSGSFRWRVRVEGQKARRIRIPVDPEHPRFEEYYWNARRGRAIDAPIEDEAQSGTFRSLANVYINHMKRMVRADRLSPLTLKQRTSFLDRVCRANPDLPEALSREHIVALRDFAADTPGSADNLVKTLRALYKWGVETGRLSENPADGVKRIGAEGKGALSWSPRDLMQYREEHPPGTMAHRYVTLLLFTGCRIGDAIWIGQDNEVADGDVIWLEWQPRKRGSAEVSLPMLPPLVEATRNAGTPYMNREDGRPFSSPEGLRNRMSKWCKEAGLVGKSSHGIRKALGGLLAEQGRTTHEIMAIHGHSSARTSEVYTKSAERRALAKAAMSGLQIDW